MAIVSLYNCRRLNTAKYAYVNKLFAESDFMFLKEHWLYNDDLPSLANIVSSLSYHGCSGMCDHKLPSGRLFGGVAILGHSRLNNVINVYKQFSTYCCALHVQLQQLSVALVSIYFPTDNQSVVTSQELVNVFDSLETFIFTLYVDCVILGGGGGLEY